MQKKEKGVKMRQRGVERVGKGRKRREREGKEGKGSEMREKKSS